MSDQKELTATVKGFLESHRKAVFAISDSDNLPTTSLMLYAVDDELNIYFGTRKAFKKYDDVLRQPVVSLTVIEEVLDPLTTLDFRGTASVVSDAEKPKIYEYFKKRNPSKYYVEDAPDFVMFKVTPSFIRYADASSGELVRTDLQLPLTGA